VILYSILILSFKNAYWSINPKIQYIVDSILIEKSRYYKFSSIIIAEVKTGRIIAMGCYNENKFDYNVCLNEKFPSASLFKITTAIASIEILNLNPDDIIYYSGRIYSEKPYLWLSNYPNKSQSFKLAFGLSNNPAFGRLAMLVGGWNLYNYGKKLFFDVYYPQNDFSLALMGAGFINSYIKPIDALKLALTISNKGIIKSITLIDSISNFYKYNVRILGRAFNEETFYKLKELFRETVISGTASKFLRNYDIGGKTGSLYDRIHNGYIEWFIGFFPVDNPEYAFVSMSVEKGYYKKLSPILNIKAVIDSINSLKELTQNYNLEEKISSQ